MFLPGDGHAKDEGHEADHASDEVDEVGKQVVKSRMSGMQQWVASVIPHTSTPPQHRSTAPLQLHLRSSTTRWIKVHVVAQRTRVSAPVPSAREPTTLLDCQEPLLGRAIQTQFRGNAAGVQIHLLTFIGTLLAPGLCTWCSLPASHYLNSCLRKVFPEQRLHSETWTSLLRIGLTICFVVSSSTSVSLSSPGGWLLSVVGPG